MKFGHFDLPNREYVITDPRTPVKWINYIGTRQFGGFLDHTGGALLCKDDPTFNRLTKYIQQMPSSDFKGTSLYLRTPFKSYAKTSEVLKTQSQTSEVWAMQNDSYQIRRGEETGQNYRVFSPFFVPTLDPYQRFECRVGLGYTRWITEFYNLRAEITIFVPLQGSCELRDIQITNLGGQAVDVDAIPLVEYSHPDALKQFTNADWVPQTMQSKAIEDGEYKILIQYPFQYRDTRINYLTSNQPAASFETDRKCFLGENEYGTFKSPLSLFQSELGNTQALRGDNIAALLHHLGAIQPGMTRRLITQFGQGASLESVRSQIQRFRDAGEVEKELKRISNFWEGYLSVMQVDTPDESANAMLNVYNPHQCYVTKTWSRYLSYYQLGLGSRGIGMRDSSQDVLAVMASVPDESKEFLRSLLSFQRRDGSAMHQFNPLTLEGSVGDSAELEDRPHYYSDDHLWCILAGIAYLKETGDISFLDEIIPFYDKDKQGNSLESGSVFEHFKRGLDFTRNDLGERGLPLLGFADWNDTVNLPSGAESLFTANLYGKTCLEMIALLEHLGDFSEAEAYRRAYAEMKSHVHSSAWDGEWYIRYIDAEGNPIGSSKNTYGQIYLNGQTWAVISGFAPPDRARKAMEAVYSRLNTRYGIKLATPGYNGYDPKYGGVTTYPPGAKENCGIFVHPNPWAVIAETMLGNGDRAYQYYSQVNPAARNDIIEVYECEPYAYAQNILGDEHPQFGLARNSWLSGTASWSYLAATQWILGIRPEFTGLRIDPCIPPAWKGFSVERRFRGQKMHIEVHNPKKICKGVLKMSIDGKTTKGNIIPTDLPGNEHHVEVWLGI